MKWPLVLLSGVLALFSVYGWKVMSVERAISIGRGAVQLGFYDLLSEQQEIYDASLQKQDDSLILILTNPDDNSFIAKGNLVYKHTKAKENFIEYQPIYYHAGSDNLMVHGMLDYLSHNKTAISTNIVDGQGLSMLKTGMMIVLGGQKTEDSRQTKDK